MILVHPVSLDHSVAVIFELVANATYDNKKQCIVRKQSQLVVCKDEKYFHRESCVSD
jgi:hypothetical protein